MSLISICKVFSTISIVQLKYKKMQKEKKRSDREVENKIPKEESKNIPSLKELLAEEKDKNLRLFMSSKTLEKEQQEKVKHFPLQIKTF